MADAFLIGGACTPVGRRYGLATMCAGVGPGTAMIGERVDG